MAVSDDDRLMMRLTGLSYRGFWRTGRGDAHVRAIRSGIERGLKEMGLSAWQIVWGPACFRPPGGWFDDQVIYVMRDPTFKPVRFVIVIRGTNPVTGHSKGGALAAAFTAWLAETRCDNPHEENWDPHRKARLRCFTFAAPTPGDRTFADILLQRLKNPAEDFRRTWNRCDIVPHAYSFGDLEEISKIYDGPFSNNKQTEVLT